ncbi:hypothetical protein LTR56_016986 [Elasticomyces elasticus]|nr:hypothetical protein LTR56_016986 [Elasticomyces elasticus]KAK3636130.1 hypothetical protein LTR22_018888 [Elasticomyces elasticus]KAK4912101.1 hypothetical protein LTR49_019387 [Elasticomyces elasticus]KAK5753653.1 hypothetical protein LTS12_016290 [Elasticomyces elasticus]
MNVDSQSRNYLPRDYYFHFVELIAVGGQVDTFADAAQRQKSDLRREAAEASLAGIDGRDAEDVINDDSDKGLNIGKVAARGTEGNVLRAY